MIAPLPAGEARSAERLRHHYDVERALADRLRAAPPPSRRTLYSSLYDELFRRIPDHPQLTRKDGDAARGDVVRSNLALLAPYLRPDAVYVEIGAGDCRLALAVAERVKKVYAVDVSAEITKHASFPGNLELVLCEGADVPVPRQSADVVFSDQLIEHLHPDDAVEHLNQVYAALAAGGSYVCITPNRLSGPHDISKYFDTEAKGFHMKEYTNHELAQMAKRAGFSRVASVVGFKGRFVSIPTGVTGSLESVLSILPRRSSQAVATTRGVWQLLGVTIVATK